MGFTPISDCENCQGTGIFAEDNGFTEDCAFCLEDAKGKPASHQQYDDIDREFYVEGGGDA